MGNPSDGFNGKTVAMSISNFWAEVTLVESQTLVAASFSNHNYFFFPPFASGFSWAVFAGAAPSSTQRSHRVWKPAGFVLHQQEGRVRPRRAGEDGTLPGFHRLVSTAPCRYLGGLRLLQATCKKFYQFCSKQG